MSVEYHIFKTPLGACAIAWSHDPLSASKPAVIGFQLPEATAKLTESRIAQRTGGQKSIKPPGAIEKIIAKVCSHLEGHVQDFRQVALELKSVGPFARQVYAAARQIPPGQTRTYGELARLVNCPAAARAVGQALGSNPIALIIPCHRVVAASGKPGGFSAHGGWSTKARMLAIEGCPMVSAW